MGPGFFFLEEVGGAGGKGFFIHFSLVPNVCPKGVPNNTLL
jgi:hypothetical protein